MNYKQIIYSDEDIEKMFPLAKEENQFIVLDSANLNNGLSFVDEDEKILNYIKKQKDLGDNGILFDFIITKTGTLYKITPDGRASRALSFDLYSEEVSVLLPSHCPQTDGSIYKRELTPDMVCTTVLIESDSDDATNMDNGVMSESTRYTLEDFLAYNYKKGMTTRKIIFRNLFPKLKAIKQRIGPSFYKNSMVGFVLLTSYAMSEANKNTIIELEKLDDVCFSK